MARHRAYREAARAALDALGDADAVIAELVALGGLRGAVNPHAVVVARLAAIPTDARERARLAADAAAGARHEAIARAERHARRLAGVEGIEAEDAEEILRDAYQEEPDALAAALAAFEGGRR
jgi:hypothetical protein